MVMQMLCNTENPKYRFLRFGKSVLDVCKIQTVRPSKTGSGATLEIVGGGEMELAGEDGDEILKRWEAPVAP